MVKAEGPVDGAVVAYAVQAVRVLEEVGQLEEMTARVGGLSLEVRPYEDLYRVVAR